MFEMFERIRDTSRDTILFAVDCAVFIYTAKQMYKFGQAIGNCEDRELLGMGFRVGLKLGCVYLTRFAIHKVADEAIDAAINIAINWGVRQVIKAVLEHLKEIVQQNNIRGC